MPQGQVQDRLDRGRASRAGAPSGPPTAFADRRTGRLRRAVRHERKEGLLLAFRLRTGVMLVVFLYLLSMGFHWDQVFDLVAIAGLCLTGWAQFKIAGTRFDQPVVMAIFPLLDVLLVAAAVFAGNEVDGDFPRVILDKERLVSWFLLLLSMQALAYQPWLAVWAGFVTACVWIGLLLWMLSYPGAHGWIDIVAIRAAPDPLAAFVRAYYDPLFVQAQIWIREALIALLIGVVLAVAAYRSQTMMSRAVQAERSRANLARYFSPTMVDQLAAKDLPFQAARKLEIGVLFADMVGFTRIAENASPESLIQLLREFHARVTYVVFEHGGTLDKFIGDCVMATFGTPAMGVDDAARTLACARGIAASVAEWNDLRRAGGLHPVQIGVGAHYGPVVLGDIGDERRLEFAVLGDTVNVASRLEGLTRELSCTILLSDDLVQAARTESDQIDEKLAEFTRERPQRLRNREEPVALWSWREPAAGDRQDPAQQAA